LIHRAPKVKGVCYIGAYAEDDEEDEVDWVAEDWVMLD
jgi:hypothetical protein